MCLSRRLFLAFIVSFFLPSHTGTYVHTLTRRRGRRKLLCTVYLVLFPTWLLVSACGPNPCVVDGILSDTNTVTRCPLTPRPHHIHPQHPLSNTRWSSVANKKSLKTDRLLGGSDLLSGVSSLSPCPLTLMTFPVSPRDVSLLFLIFYSVSLSRCSSFLPPPLFISMGLEERAGGHLQPTDVLVLGFYKYN